MPVPAAAVYGSVCTPVDSFDYTNGYLDEHAGEAAGAQQPFRFWRGSMVPGGHGETAERSSRSRRAAAGQPGIGG